MQRPLVVRFGALGDMVMITPLLRAIAERSGQACDVVGSGAWTKDIFKHLPFVNEVYVIRGRKTPYWFSAEQKNMVKALRKRGTSPLWLLEDMPKAWRLMQRVGFTADQAVRMQDHQRGVDEHTVKHWIRLAALQPPLCDWPAPGVIAENCLLAVSDDELQDCRQWLQQIQCEQKKIILIQAGSKKTMKGGKPDRASNLKFWPRERWSAVIQQIIAGDEDARVLLCGAPNEQELACEIRDSLGDQRVLAVADQLPLRRLLALMSVAHSCISVDTGPAHIAAACNCPLVVLFGQTNPRLYQPISAESPVHVVSQTAIEEVAPGSAAWAALNTMDGISVDAVVSAWQQLDAAL